MGTNLTVHGFDHTGWAAGFARGCNPRLPLENIPQQEVDSIARHRWNVEKNNRLPDRRLTRQSGQFQQKTQGNPPA